MTRVFGGASLLPPAGARLWIDAYETAIEITAELQMSVAQAISVEPYHSFATAWAGATRDIGAAQVSTLRWLLDDV